jgi:N-acetylneuraminic acid mutarotase
MDLSMFLGEQPEGTFNNNKKFDTVSNKWTSEKSMPTARHGLVVVSFDNKIYVIGGGPQPSGSGTI